MQNPSASLASLVSSLYQDVAVSKASKCKTPGEECVRSLFPGSWEQWLTGPSGLDGD